MVFPIGGDKEDKTWIIKSECLFLLMIRRSLSMSKVMAGEMAFIMASKWANLIITVKYATVIKDRRH